MEAKKSFDPLSQLSKHGWTSGSGLGRDEAGIKEAIKVKLKFDQTGVGHNAADQFTFHWWDHAFNKAADNIQVKETQNGVEIESGATMDEISNKKKSVNVEKKDMLYGMFVKSSTVTNEGEIKQSKTDSGVCSDSSSDSDSELEGADIGTASKLTDDQLRKICGGRTAHKGARHGLCASGKLARIAEQESIYHQNSAVSSPANSAPSSPKASATVGRSSTVRIDEENVSKVKKLKKKKKKSKKEHKEDISCQLDQTQEMSKKKSKLRTSEAVNDGVESLTIMSDVPQCTLVGYEERSSHKKKSKKKSRDLERITDQLGCVTGQSMDNVEPKKKRKKKSTDEESAPNVESSSSNKKKLKSKGYIISEPIVGCDDNSVECHKDNTEKLENKEKLKTSKKRKIENLDNNEIDQKRKKKKSKKSKNKCS